MKKLKFSLLNQYEIEFYLQLIQEFNNNNILLKKDGIVYYSFNDKIAFKTGKYFICFNAQSDLELFIKKVGFLITKKYNEFIFFELLDKDDIKTILVKNLMTQLNNLFATGQRIFRLNDGCVLSVDPNFKYGELYQSINNYIDLNNELLME